MNDSIRKHLTTKSHWNCDGDSLFVTGGFIDFDTKYDSNKSFLYHSDTMEWEEVPDLPTLRISLLCGMVHNANGDEEVIAAGGFDHGEGPLSVY